ncbi:MAG TPA: hypothetical protein VGN08_13485 [Solirubrobacteraceae bacterium]|jgi:hypothetical protein
MALVGGGAAGAAAASPSITKPQAIEFARQVNLTAADVPGAVMGPTEPEAKPTRSAVRLARCSGGVNPNLRVADVPSPAFALGKGRSLVELRSDVEVLPMAALATRSFDALSSARGHACLRRMLPASVKVRSKHGVRLGRISVSFLSGLLPAGQKSFGARIALTFTNGARKVTLFTDAIEVLAGPAAVGLNVVAAFHPPSSALERRLLSALYARASSHPI